jgi:hypothetical protein
MLPVLKGATINPSKRPLYQVLATLSEAIDNCRNVGNTEWAVKHGNEMDRLCREYLPSGSGFDNGTRVWTYGGPVNGFCRANVLIAETLKLCGNAPGSPS